MDDTKEIFKQLGLAMDAPKHASTVLDLLQTSSQNEEQFLAVYAAFEKPIAHVPPNKLATLLTSYYKKHGVTKTNKHILRDCGRKLPKKCQLRIWEHHQNNPILHSVLKKPENNEHGWAKEAHSVLKTKGYAPAKYLLEKHVLQRDGMPLQIKTVLAVYDFLEDLSQQPANFKDFIHTYSWTGNFILNSDRARLAAVYFQTENKEIARGVINNGLAQYAYRDYPNILAHKLGARFSMKNPRVANIVRYTQDFLEPFLQCEDNELAQIHLMMIKKNCPQITQITDAPYLPNEDLADYFFRVAQTPNTIDPPLLRNLRQFETKQIQWNIVKKHQKLKAVADKLQVPPSTKAKV